MSVELVKPDFIVGSEKRFFEFIGKLNDKEKIASISHRSDLDGITSAKVVNSVVNVDFLKLIEYEDLNMDLARELKDKKIKRVIFTDIKIDEVEVIKEIEKFAEILIIDHHKIDHDYNSNRTVFLNAQEFSAGYLSYYLFSKVQNIEKLDWLVASSCVSDFCHKKPAEWLKKIFSKYGDEFEFEGNYVRKSGKIWDLQYDLSLSITYYLHDIMKVYDSIGSSFGEIGDLKEKAQIVKAYVSTCLVTFEKEKKTIPDGYFWEFTPKFKIGGMIGSMLGSRYPDKTIIVARNEEKIYSFSARRQDKKKDMDLFIKSMTYGLEHAGGGGHVGAAGGHVMLADKETFKKRLGVK